MVSDASIQPVPTLEFPNPKPASFRRSRTSRFSYILENMYQHAVIFQIFPSPLDFMTFIYICNMLSYLSQVFVKQIPFLNLWSINCSCCFKLFLFSWQRNKFVSSKPPLLGRHGAARRFATQNFAVSVALWTGAVLIGSCLQRCILYLATCCIAIYQTFSPWTSGAEVNGVGNLTERW